MPDKIYLLRRGSSEDDWFEIKEGELDLWFKDGSIQNGDLIVYVSKVLRAVEHTTLSLEEAKE